MIERRLEHTEDKKVSVTLLRRELVLQDQVKHRRCGSRIGPKLRQRRRQQSVLRMRCLRRCRPRPAPPQEPDHRGGCD
jgi:hypothetical protein